MEARWWAWWCVLFKLLYLLPTSRKKVECPDWGKSLIIWFTFDIIDHVVLWMWVLCQVWGVDPQIPFPSIDQRLYLGSQRFWWITSNDRKQVWEENVMQSVFAFATLSMHALTYNNGPTTEITLSYWNCESLILQSNCLVKRNSKINFLMKFELFIYINKCNK